VENTNRYTEEAVRAAVSLSQRYISDRFLPDKAVDLLDEAGSRVRLLQLKDRAQHLDLVRPLCKPHLLFLLRVSTRLPRALCQADRAL
jgi:ATP-dependent Clp protease ATP-binding subunit ClpA